MGTTVTDIISGIEGLAEAFLGPDYSKLSHGINVEKNRDMEASKRYAVLPQDATQRDFVGALVMDQVFVVKITDNYRPDELEDHEAQSLTNALYDKAYGLYEYIVSNKCGAPSVVKITFGLDVGTPEYLDEEVVIIELSFTVKHLSN